MPNQTAIINGINYSWANISVIIFGVPLVGITAIEYKRKLKKENNYGAGQQPVSRGYGNYEYEGSIEIYTDTLKQFIAATATRDILKIAPFKISISFSGEGVLTTKDVLNAVEFLEDPFDSKSGDTKIMCKIPIIIGSIDR